MYHQLLGKILRLLEVTWSHEDFCMEKGGGENNVGLTGLEMCSTLCSVVTLGTMKSVCQGERWIKTDTRYKQLVSTTMTKPPPWRYVVGLKSVCETTLLRMQSHNIKLRHDSRFAKIKRKKDTWKMQFLAIFCLFQVSHGLIYRATYSQVPIPINL